MNFPINEVFDGNESEREVLALVQEALATFFDETAIDHRLRYELNGSSSWNSWLTVRHPNGAEFQVSVARAAWPQDGSSAQFADVEDDGEDVECERCGSYGASPDTNLCPVCEEALHTNDLVVG